MSKITLGQLRDHIANLPEPKFDYSRVLGREPVCGLVGCVAGWAATLDFRLHNPKAELIEVFDEEEYYDPLHDDYEGWFAEYFNLPQRVVKYLTEADVFWSELDEVEGIAHEVIKARLEADPDNYGTSMEAAVAALNVVIHHFPNR